MEKLTDMLNIGKIGAENLSEIGITTAEELKQMGSKKAFMLIRSHVDSEACISKLCAMEGAIQGVRWHYLSDEVKTDLKMFYKLLNNYEIAELSLNDLTKCMSFWGYSNGRIEEFISSGSRRVFGYKVGKEFFGGCVLIIDNKTKHGHFSDFFVREDLRGNGIGSRILDFSINLFEKNKIKTVRLHVMKNNLSAIKLYGRYGFKYFEDVTDDKIAMIKTCGG